MRLVIKGKKRIWGRKEERKYLLSQILEKREVVGLDWIVLYWVSKRYLSRDFPCFKATIPSLSIPSSSSFFLFLSFTLRKREGRTIPL
ncbi:hypothetical protein VNO77_16953 [Canavalia gladiata]|uniref:Uncharacterized protein n=1 Tax=Canavalia gladiata TaxID=3824 RepID=A0AAN9LN04_CANGL